MSCMCMKKEQLGKADLYSLREEQQRGDVCSSSEVKQDIPGRLLCPLLLLF